MNNVIVFLYNNKNWIFNGIGILGITFLIILLKKVNLLWKKRKNIIEKCKFLIKKIIKVRQKTNTFSHTFFWHNKKITINAFRLPDNWNFFALTYDVSGKSRNSILHRGIMGHSFQIYDIDLDGDGQSEIIVTFHCGGHSMGIHIFKFDGQILHPISPPAMGSDWPEIKWEDNDYDGKYEIYCKHRVYSDFEKCLCQKFILDEHGKYKLVKETEEDIEQD